MERRYATMTKTQNVPRPISTNLALARTRKWIQKDIQRYSDMQTEKQAARKITVDKEPNHILCAFPSLSQLLQKCLPIQIESFESLSGGGTRRQSLNAMIHWRTFSWPGMAGWICLNVCCGKRMHFAGRSCHLLLFKTSFYSVRLVLNDLRCNLLRPLNRLLALACCTKEGNFDSKQVHIVAQNPAGPQGLPKNLAPSLDVSSATVALLYKDHVPLSTLPAVFSCLRARHFLQTQGPHRTWAHLSHADTSVLPQAAQAFLVSAHSLSPDEEAIWVWKLSSPNCQPLFASSPTVRSCSCSGTGCSWAAGIIP